ncbi:MAG: ABC transporter substrate-binding protein, partial [Actinomycetota bacterium]
MPEPASIDPSRAADAERGGLRPGVLVLSLICDPLVGANPITGVLKPGVAESWTIAPDAKKVIFRLRAGVRFHNGRELVAQDYVYSLSRFAHPDTGSVQHFFLEKVAGYQDVRRRRAAELTGVRAPDPRTLEVELSEPFAELPALLSHPAAGSAVPKEEVDKGAEAFGRAPVCTGPYRPAAPWAPGSGEIRLARFNDYVAGGPDSPLGAGFADEIVLKTVPDAEAGYALFEREALEASEVPIGRLSAAREGKVGVEGGSNGLLAYLGFPAGKPPFDKADFRRALSLAIDRQAIVEGVFAGSRQVPAGFLPPAAGPGSPANACPETVKGRADPKAAAVALMSSGLDPASTKPPIYFNDAGSGHAIWIAKVAEQWKAGLGIEPSLQ